MRQSTLNTTVIIGDNIEFEKIKRQSEIQKCFNRKRFSLVLAS